MAVFLLVLSMCAADPPAVLGWQPAPAGGREYLIQLAPETLDQLRQGYAVLGTLPLPGGGVASYRITAGRSEVPRRDGEITTAGRVTTDDPPSGASSAGWATSGVEQANRPAAAENRPNASAAGAAVRRIEDMPDAPSPSTAAGAARWNDLPPLGRSDLAKTGATSQRDEQEYRPPGVGPTAGDAVAPRVPSDATRPTNTVVPPLATTDRNAPPSRSLLPIADNDRGSAKPLERPAGGAAAAPSPPTGPGGAAAPLGSTGPTNRPAETTPAANQPSDAVASAGPPTPTAEAKPWGTLVFVGALLFASLGLNVFLGWTAWEYRRRCESLTAQNQ